jgi:hypothetical protein
MFTNTRLRKTSITIVAVIIQVMTRFKLGTVTWAIDEAYSQHYMCALIYGSVRGVPLGIPCWVLIRKDCFNTSYLTRLGDSSES